MFELDPGIIIWTGVTFTLLLLTLYTVALPPLLNIMQKRKQVIEESLKQSKDARLQAESLLSDYKQKREELEQQTHLLLDRARLSAEKMRAETLKTAEKEIQNMRQQIKLEAAAEKHEILQEIKQDLSGLVLAATEKVLGREVKSADNERIIKEEIDGLNQL